MLKCVILAAGRGSRLCSRPEIKPLCRVRGRALIDWVILSAWQAGLRDFVVVTGYARDTLERHLRTLARELHLRMVFAFNDEWQRENGISASHAQEFAGDAFVLLMADHVFDPEILTRLTAQPVAPGELLLAADFRVRHHPTVDLDDVTKILVEDGRISGIGKRLDAYNAFDTGIFLVRRPSSKPLPRASVSATRASRAAFACSVRVEEPG